MRNTIRHIYESVLVEATPGTTWMTTGKYLIAIKGNDIVVKKTITFQDGDNVLCVEDGNLIWYNAKTGEQIDPPKEVKGWLNLSEVGVEFLDGCPEKVNGNFECADNPDLHTLEGGPKVVTGYYNVCRNPNLVILKGVATQIGGDFNCHNCDKLTSFKGLENTKIGHNLICSYTENLTSYEGLPPPQNIAGQIRCDNKMQAAIKSKPELEGYIAKLRTNSEKTAAMRKAREDRWGKAQ